jgi:hypothetical protein
LDREEVEKISKDSKDQQATIESLGNNLTLLNQSNADNIKSLKKAVKKIEDLNRTVQEVQKESLKNAENYEKVKLELIERNEQTMKFFKENSTAELSAHLESAKDLNKMLSLQFSEVKALLENERLQCKLREANYLIDKQAMDFELKALKQEIAELKIKLEGSSDETRNLKIQLNETIQKKLDDFMKKLMEDNRA